MVVKIKKLDPKAVTPAYAKAGDAAVDLTAISIAKVDRDEFGYMEYGTGLAIEIPEGHVGLLFPRSSISNSGLILTNSVGVIDSKPKVSHV
jgi:dUTP pyrophosphatase